MKYMNIIKLLSVLLCIVMLFAACAKTDEGENQSEAESTNTEAEVDTQIEEAPLTDVSPEFGSFFEMVEKTEPLMQAVRVEGTIVSSDRNKNFFVLKTEDIDVKNNVTEEYALYNVVTGAVTLNLTNTYFNGDYDQFSWGDLMVKETVGFEQGTDGTFVKVENSKKYHETYLDVYIDSIGSYYYESTPYVVVRSATVTPIDEAVREENPDGCVYKIVTKYQYYDVYGNLIAESNGKLQVNNLIYENTDIVAVKFGATLAYFDGETHKLVSADARFDTDKISGVYSYENDKYGYNLDGITYVANLGSVRYIEIIDKAQGKVAYRYYLNDNYQYVESFLLHNGDVLIQYRNRVEEDEPYNCYDQDDECYYNVAHEIFSVKDGKATEIELGYYFDDICDGQVFAEEYLENHSIAVTDNARNVAYARAFDKNSMESRNVYVFDNDMTLLYEYEKLALEHKITLDNGFGVTVLDNGEYLVDLDKVVTDKAIVKADGTVRSYIPNTMNVGCGFVYDDKNIYDYDLNPVFSLEEASMEVCDEMFGKLLLRFDHAFKDGEMITDPEYVDHHRLYKDETTGKYFSLTIGYDPIKVIEIGENYSVVRRESDGKYEFRSSFNDVELVTYNEMRVYSFDGGYIVLTNVEGQDVLYKIN